MVATDHCQSNLVCQCLLSPHGKRPQSSPNSTRSGPPTPGGYGLSIDSPENGRVPFPLTARHYRVSVLELSVIYEEH